MLPSRQQQMAPPWNVIKDVIYGELTVTETVYVFQIRYGL